MIETMAGTGQPLLYITTRTSERASSIASTIKISLDHVLRFMEERGVGPAGKPVAIFTDWNDHLVTLEVGYPVEEDALKQAGGRVQAGRTPDGQAACVTGDTVAADYVRRHTDFATRLRAAGHRSSGTSWEVYTIDPMGGVGTTELCMQLLAPPSPG